MCILNKVVSYFFVKAKFFLWIKFSVNPSGSGVAFASPRQCK